MTPHSQPELDTSIICGAECATAAQDIRKCFGQVLRSLRLAKGQSQKEFAAQAKLHRTYITDVEHGRRNVSLETICTIAEAIGVSLSTLFAQVERHQGIKHSQPTEPLHVIRTHL